MPECVPHLAQNNVALAGEFLVLGELALRGLDGALTLGHAKEIDILVLNRRNGRTFKLEVKTTATGARRSSVFGCCFTWFMHKRHGGLRATDLVYCFVVVNNDARRFFLVPATDVATYIEWEYVRFVTRPRRRTGGTASMRTFRVPATAEPCPMPDAWGDARWTTWENDWGLFDRLPIQPA